MHAQFKQDCAISENRAEKVGTGESKVVGKSFSNKRRNLLFSLEENATILNKQMLTDESVNIARNILKKQFPKIAGLQDTVIGKTQAFGIIRKEEKYIQILHARSFHWICVANTQKNKTGYSYC